MDGLNEDLKKYEERTRPTSTSSTVSSSGDWMWDLPFDSTPTIDTTFPDYHQDVVTNASVAHALWYQFLVQLPLKENFKSWR